LHADLRDCGFVLTGMVPYQELGKTADPLAHALSCPLSRGWLDCGAGAAVSMSAVLLVFQYASTHLLRHGARRPIAEVGRQNHPRTHIPWATTLLTGIFVALCRWWETPAKPMTDEHRTLFAFILVSIGCWCCATKSQSVAPFPVPLCGRSACFPRQMPVHHEGSARPGLGAIRRLAGDRVISVLPVRLQAQRVAAGERAKK